MSSHMFSAICLVSFWAVITRAQPEERAVIDIERASWGSGLSLGESYGQLGLYMGRRELMNDAAYFNRTFFQMRPDAINGIGHVFLQHLDPVWDVHIYEDLRAFEQDEVRQGRRPFFITATYAGQKRPVLSLGRLAKGEPIAQAVNVGDDRFIKFWLKSGIRRKLSLYALQNWGFCTDNSQFGQNPYYVVLDDTGGQHYVTWDKPFPQSEREWTDAGKYALRRIKELAPDLTFLQNQFEKPISDMSRYAEVFEPIDGVWVEHFMLSDPTDRRGVYQIDGRNHFRNALDRLLPPNGADANKIQVFIVYRCTSIDELRTRFIAYLILSGPNAFFNPRFLAGGPVEPDLYMDIRAALGSAVGPPTSVDVQAKGWGWCVWLRRFEGGVAYLNLTGLAKTISLPADGPFYDADGNRVSQVVLGDLRATYVVTEPGARITKPRINPRRPGLVTGPLMITLEPEPFTPANDSRIVYTLDGSEPDESSTAYAGPFEIHKSCVVRAKAFPSQGSRRSRTPALPSFTNSATYTLTDKEPTVEFHLASDGGSEFMEHDYPVVSLSHVSTHPVTVTYQACAGTATPRSDYVLQPGTLTLAPGEQHRCFYLHVINDTESEPDETIVLSLSNPVNAVLGEKTTYTYTIEDNDPAPNSSTGSEGFEAGNFSAVPWERDGDSPWQVTSTEKNSGSYSARAGSISDGQTSTLKLTRICKSGTISFYVKTSSEPFLDTLMFRIDGAVVDEWFGDTDWTEASYAVGAGSHTFEWSYVKDDSVTSGEDTAWLDDIMFP